jgi:response regulator RpfG family c-di-GMP phosphodiesterase
MTRAKVLCVDDEARVLEGLRNTLETSFEVATASGGETGLEVLAREAAGSEPVAVVISDMRMPGMDGTTFLTRARERFPDTTRILLTGQADLNAAVAAVNRGNIFRFLIKPCPPEELIAAVEASVRQWRLVTAEREILDKTLKAAAATLGDILSLSAPYAFSRCGALCSYVEHMMGKIPLQEPWPVEVAAHLALIGMVSVPEDTLARYYAGRDLSEEENRLLTSQCEVGYRLLARIPRMETVAAIVRCQDPAVTMDNAPRDVQIGAAMLRVAHAIDRLVLHGHSVPRAVEQLLASDSGHDRVCLQAMMDFKAAGTGGFEIRAVRVRELTPAMRLDEDVRSLDGRLMLSSGHMVTPVLIERLASLRENIGLREPIRVRVSRAESEDIGQDRAA